MHLLRYGLLVLVLAFGTAPVSLAPTPAIAQAAEDAPDYEIWERTATRAEEAVEAGRASTTALEQLRRELVEWRTKFSGAQQANRASIATVQRQLDALGAAPEDGVESADVASKREDLNQKLAELQSPVKKAEIAHSRAEGLIKGVDRIIRDRQTEELLEFGPSPINPEYWQPALSALTHTIASLQGEIVSAWENPVQRANTQEDLPAVILLLLLGIVLVVRGRRWSRRVMNTVLTENPGPSRWIAAFVISTGSLVLPFLGVVAITEAIYATGLVGLRGEQALAAVLPAAFIFLVSRWLATRVFPAREARTLSFALDDAQRFSGRWFGATLGLAAAWYLYFRDISEISRWSEEINNTLLFPFMVLAALLLLRLARLLRLHGRPAGEDKEVEENYRTRLVRLLALALSLLAIVTPVLAAVGYFRLAHALLFPSLASLLLLAALMVLQRVVVEVYVLISGNRDGAAESLIPVLIGFILVLVSVPLFALAWGARVTELTEIWVRVTEGFDVGGTRISPKIFLTFAIVFVIGYLATRLLQGALKNSILPKTKIDQGARNALVSGIGYVGIFLAAVIAITSAGIDLSSIAIVAGALSVGIGFGLQNIVSNFVSGIILLIERPISEGDWIEVGGVHGTVKDISVRSTVIETFDRSDVILPNSDLVSGRVTNYTKGNTIGRVVVPVGVAYGSDTQQVEQILQEVAEAHPMVLANPAPYAVFRSFGESSLDFEIRAILRDVNWILSVHSEMNHEIAKRFAEAGIEIPFAQRDIWIRNPDALQDGPAATAVSAKLTGSKSSGKAHIIAEDVDGDAGADGGDR